MCVSCTSGLRTLWVLVCVWWGKSKTSLLFVNFVSVVDIVYAHLSSWVTSDSCDPTDCSPEGSSAHEISQARTLEWGSGLLSPSPGDLPHPGIEPTSPPWAGGFFTPEPPGQPRISPCIRLYVRAEAKRLMQSPQSSWGSSLWACGQCRRVFPRGRLCCTAPRPGLELQGRGRQPQLPWVFPPGRVRAIGKV